MGKVSYVPAGDATRVEVAIRLLDETVVASPGEPFVTDDPAIQGELDLVPALERAKPAAKPSGKDDD